MDNASWVVHFFNWIYVFGFLPVLIPAALMLFLFRHETYVFYRNIFLVSYIFTWLLYLTFPLAPPRLMIEEGFIDSVEVMGPAMFNSKQSLSYYNQYSAMPSMHFGWTLLFSAIFVRSSFKPLRTFGAIYPVLALGAIVVTANHYILDAVVGGVIIGGSYCLYLIMRRVPPRFPGQPDRAGPRSLPDYGLKS